MIFVITRVRASDNTTHVDCVIATQRRAREYVDVKNREDTEWFYQMWEREIE